MSSEPIILYDLPSKAPCEAWSYNPWRTRLLLNFKGIDYKTEWTEYPDIRKKFQDHVTLPEGEDTYTIPTIRTSDGNIIMDSNRIAEYLEEKYPSPSIHLDTPYKKKVLDQMIPIMAAVRVVFLPIMSVRVLSPGSVDYWNETRPKAFGKPFSEITEEERGDKAWAKAEEPIKEITRLLKENPDGPFFDGKTVTYADFYWAAYLLFWQKIGDDKFQKLLGVSGEAGKSDNVHLQLLEAVKPWSDRRDH